MITDFEKDEKKLVTDTPLADYSTGYFTLSSNFWICEWKEKCNSSRKNTFFFSYNLLYFPCRRKYFKTYLSDILVLSIFAGYPTDKIWGVPPENNDWFPSVTLWLCEGLREFVHPSLLLIDTVVVGGGGIVVRDGEDVVVWDVVVGHPVGGA